MEYFGSTYFMMSNGLVAGIKSSSDSDSYYGKVKISFVPLKNIKKVYASSMYKHSSSIYDYDNKSFKGWGSNKFGELGLGKDIDYTNEIVDIPINYNDVKKVFRTSTAGDFYGTIFIMKNGTVKGCGINLYGYEGTTQYSIVDLPVTNVKDVYATLDQWYFIYNDNTIKGKGNNTNGKLGIGNNVSNITVLTSLNISPIGITNIISFNDTTLFLYDSGCMMFSGKSFELCGGSKLNYGVTPLYSPLNYLTNTPINTLFSGVKKIGMSISYFETEKPLFIFLHNDGYMMYSNNDPKNGFSYSNIGINKRIDIDDFLSYRSSKEVYYLYKDSSADYRNWSYNTLDDFNTNIILDRKMSNIKPWSFKDNNKVSDFKIELWKNREEVIGDIDIKWIDKITYKYNTEISEFQLKIPKFIGGQNKLNPIYNIIKSNYQVIINRIDGVKESYILKEQIIYNEKLKGAKTFTAFSLQKKLEDIHMKINEKNYSLYNDPSYKKNSNNILSVVDNSNDIENGILDEVEHQSGWSIGYVDESAKKELITVKEIKEDYTSFQNDFRIDYSYYINKTTPTPISGDILDGIIKSGDKLISNTSSINTVNNTIGKEPLYLTITYKNMLTSNKSTITRYENDTYSSLIRRIGIGVSNVDCELVDYGNIYHEFDEPFHNDITKMEVYYHNEVGNRCSLKYVFTLRDGSQNIIIKPFINLDNKWVDCSIVISYTTGNYIKENTLLKPWFETTDDTVAKVLSDISDVFNVAFEFDTINKFIHVHSLNSLGTTSDEASSQLGQFILGTSKLGTNQYSITDSANLMLSYNDVISVNKTDNDSDIISGLKVVGKDNLSIVNINPNGTDTIENWNYFINNGNLTDSCIASLSLYNSTLKTRQANWNTMSQSYLDMNNTLITYESKIKSYQEQIIGLQSILSAYKTVNDTVNATRIQGELTSAQGILNSTINSKTILEDDLKELSDTMATYSEGSRKENIVDGNGNKIFSWSDLQILNDLTNIQTVNDDYFSDELALYEHYSQSMVEKVKPKVQFTTKTGNMSKYVYLNSNIIKLGLWYELDEELQKVFNEKRIRLISFEYYPNKGNIGSFENLTYSNKVTSINKFRKSATTTSKVEKTSQTVSKISSNTNKISNNLTDKVGTDSLINYNTNISGELDTKLSSVDFDNRFNNRESTFDFTMGSNSTKVKIDKNSMVNNGGSFVFTNSNGDRIIDDRYNVLKEYTKGTSSVTLGVGETSKTVIITTFANGVFTKAPYFEVYSTDDSHITKTPLPYLRINTSYIFDMSFPFELIGQVTANATQISVTFTRPNDYKNVSETIQLEYIVFKE